MPIIPESTSARARGGLHLWLGPDRPRKLERLLELERTLMISPLDRHQVNAAEVSPPELLALCRQQPAASPVRFIVVDQAQRLDGPPVEALVGLGGLIASTACVVLLVEVELSVRHALSRAGAALTVERFMGREAPPLKPFALTDALGVRDVAGALNAVRDQLMGGRDAVDVLGLIAWQVQRWVLVKRLTAAGLSADGISSVTGLRAWQVQRLQSEVAQRPLDALQWALARCWQLDVETKSGRHVPDLAVEQLVVELSSVGAAG